MIGVIKDVAECKSIYSSRVEKEFQKRDVTIVDKSLYETSLTLWESDAIDFQAVAKDVIAIKGAKVSDFGGVTLGSTRSSVIQINPDILECHALREWYESVGSTMATTSLNQSNPNAGITETKFKTFGEMKRENFSNGQPQYFSNMAWVTNFSKGKEFYPMTLKLAQVSSFFTQIRLCTKDVLMLPLTEESAIRKFRLKKMVPIFAKSAKFPHQITTGK